jgi:hypothetical protein
MKSDRLNALELDTPVVSRASRLLATLMRDLRNQFSN